MRKLTLNDLPEVFVPFEAIKTHEGKVVYHNPHLDGGLGAAQLLSKYSYVTSPCEADIIAADDKKNFFAERYGGDGILNNGGGARCGFDGFFQLKGIGVNQLLGVRSRDIYGNSHANGLLCLNIAIYESVWAEIIQLALPYGAVSTVAIIDLEVEFEESNSLHPRALLLRLPAVRPAHFIRAIYFKEKKYHAISEDAQRVSAAIRKLALFLPGINACQESDTLSERLNVGMVELATRYAKQFATARAKRIYHSNVSASNITIDGAWLDLSRSAVFSERLWWDGFDLNSFKNEYMPAINSIREMCFYLSKYGAISANESNIIFERALSTFNTEYERASFLCNMVQVGFPLCIMRDVTDAPCFLSFAQKLRKVLAKDKYTAIPVCAGSWQGYEHGVRRLYLQLLKGKYNGEIADLSWFCEDRSLVNELIISYEELFDLVVSKAAVKGVKRKNLASCIAINLTRLNRFNSVLVELSNEIVNAIRNAGQCGDVSHYKQLFERAALAGSHAFQYDEGFNLIFWQDEAVTVTFDALPGLFVVEGKEHKNINKGSFAEIKRKAGRMDSMFCFYESIEDVFYE